METTTEKPLDMKTEMSLQINEHTEFQVGYIKTDYPWTHYNEKAQHERQKDQTESLQERK